MVADGGVKKEAVEDDRPLWSGDSDLNSDEDDEESMTGKKDNGGGGVQKKMISRFKGGCLSSSCIGGHMPNEAWLYRWSCA